MKRLVSLILVIITVSTSFAQKIGGTWKGKLNAGNQKLLSQSVFFRIHPMICKYFQVVNFYLIHLFLLLTLLPESLLSS